jgi:hypothetical protein
VEQLLGEITGINAFGAREYVCSFVPNGTGTPTGLKGFGVTGVTYAATGLWLVQLADANFLRLLWADGIFAEAAGGNAVGWGVEVDFTNTNLATGVIAFASINTSRARAALTPSANTTVYLSFMLTKDSLDA